MEIKNKGALFDYEIIERFVAGIILTGSEIKSIRLGKASLVDTYCVINNDGIWMLNSYIAQYDNASFFNHNTRRNRKLLLTKQEQRKLHKGVSLKGNTIVPLKMFINKRGLCKIEIALAKGKKEYDKRESIKKRDIERELKQY